MKKQLKNLIKTRDELIAIIEKRDATSLEKSEAWNKSDAGKSHEARTGTLANTIDLIDETIAALKPFKTL